MSGGWRSAATASCVSHVYSRLRRLHTDLLICGTLYPLLLTVQVSRCSRDLKMCGFLKLVLHDRAVTLLHRPGFYWSAVTAVLSRAVPRVFYVVYSLLFKTK